MTHRPLDDPAALPDQERAEESVGSAEHREPQRDLAREDPDRAARIPDRLPEHRIAHSVGQPADHALGPDVLARPPPAEGRVKTGQNLPERGKIALMVL